MATHSSVLAWRIPGTGEPVGLPSVGPHRVYIYIYIHTHTHTHTHTVCIIYIYFRKLMNVYLAKKFMPF